MKGETIMDNSRQNKTDVGRSACEIAWGAEEARKMDEMVERTGHPCAGSVGQAGDHPS